MLLVVCVLGGSVVAFLGMVLWANDGRFKSEQSGEV